MMATTETLGNMTRDIFRGDQLTDGLIFSRQCGNATAPQSRKNSCPRHVLLFLLLSSRSKRRDQGCIKMTSIGRDRLALPQYDPCTGSHVPKSETP